MNGVNYYQLFAVSPSVSADELRVQYRQLSLTHHPDRGGSTEQMAMLNEAYRVLSNPLLRREYDQQQALLQAQHDGYYVSHYQPRPAAQATAVEQPVSHFWRWFSALVILGVALIAYDVMMTWVMPRYVIQGSASAPSEHLTPSGDLTDEAASALSEFQSQSQAPSRPMTAPDADWR